MEPIEAAFSCGEYDNEWFARITWKCPVDGRRNCKLLKGAGRLKDALPIKVFCKHGHETAVMPYHWAELQPKWSS